MHRSICPGMIALCLALAACAPTAVIPPAEPMAQPAPEPPPAAAAPEPSVAIDLSGPKYLALLNELETQHGFNADALAQLFSRAKFLPDVPQKFAKPAEALPYDQYRPIFITPDNVEQGKAFLARHRELLTSIEQHFGVDGAVIAAILSVETKFGKRTDGGYLVFDALNTTFAGVPNREAFARKELIEFLLLCRDEGLDPLAVKGSYAGAMGTPQFIASSYRRFTVDYDGDGKRDLWGSYGDIFASVANYLKMNGWRPGAPTRLPVTVNGEASAARAALDQGLQGKITIQKLLETGVAWAGEPVHPLPIDDSQEVSLLAYPSTDGEKTVALFPNFRAIMTYNRAVNYALVVSDLADLLGRSES
ncbi:MAG: lytic murein transglycosylase [Nitrospirota bacterium]